MISLRTCEAVAAVRTSDGVPARKTVLSWRGGERVSICARPLGRMRCDLFVTRIRRRASPCLAPGRYALPSGRTMTARPSSLSQAPIRLDIADGRGDVLGDVLSLGLLRNVLYKQIEARA